jgi:hypothetical protein
MAWHFRNLSQALVKGARALLLGSLQSGCLLQKVWTACVPNEQEIAAEHRNRLVGSATMVRYQKDDVFGCVTWRVHSL